MRTTRNVGAGVLALGLLGFAGVGHAQQGPARDGGLRGGMDAMREAARQHGAAAADAGARAGGAIGGAIGGVRGAVTSVSGGSVAQTLEVVGTFPHVPVGVAASSDGRVFLAFSRAIDPTVPLSVAELKDGQPVPFPKGFQQAQGAPGKTRLLSVQSVSVDGKDRLWMLDSAKVGTQPVKPGAPKLVGVDLKTGKVVKTVVFRPEVAGKTSFLNDLRVDLRQGREGVVYLTDASPEGPNGLVVVDLATGKQTRRLDDHPSTKADPALTPTVGGQPLVQKTGPMAGKPFAVGADGIALSADGRWLYYSPLTSRRLYRVDAAALRDAAKTDTDLAAGVEDLGDKGFAADGLLEDAQGRVLVTDFENDAVHRRGTDGRMELLVRSPKLRWPDTLALLPDGTLLVTVTQIDRSERFQGKDARERPFTLYRVKTDSTPARHVAP